jgi:predicted porin
VSTPSCHRALALCAAGVLLATTASAQSSNVVIYGLFDAAVRHVNNANADRASLTTMEDGIFTGSRLGFRGREELGDGIAAVFTMEAGFDPSSGASSQGTATADFGQTAANPRFWGREIHAGLRSSLGGVTLGRQYTLAHGVTARFQPQGNPNNAADSIFSSHHIARQDNMLRLDANLGGVDLAASHTFGETAATGGSDAWAVSAGYGSGPFWVGGYIQRLNNLADSETRKIIGFGGNYKITSALTAYAGAMRRTSAVSPQTNKVWTLGFNFDITPSITLSAAHLADRQSGSATLEGSRKVSYVTANYRFSKRTDVYAVVDQNRVKGGYVKPAFMGTKGTQDGLSFGLRHRF